jgi:hypothetical protein
MFPRSTTASINRSASRRSLPRPAVTLDAPTPLSRSFRLLPRRIGSGFSTILPASPSPSKDQTTISSSHSALRCGRCTYYGLGCHPSIMPAASRLRLSLSEQTNGLPRVRRVTFTPYTRCMYDGLTPSDFGLRIFWPARPVSRRLKCTSCTSGRGFACSFLRITPCGAHPCCSAKGSGHYGPWRDLHPPCHLPVRFRYPVIQRRHGAARHAWRTK